MDTDFIFDAQCAVPCIQSKLWDIMGSLLGDTWWDLSHCEFSIWSEGWTVPNLSNVILVCKVKWFSGSFLYVLWCILHSIYSSLVVLYWPVLTTLLDVYGVYLDLILTAPRYRPKRGKTRRTQHWLRALIALRMPSPGTCITSVDGLVCWTLIVLLGYVFWMFGKRHPKI